MICVQLTEYEPSTSLHVDLDLQTLVCLGTVMAVIRFLELSTLQCVYLHPGNCLFDKSILRAPSPIENVPAYYTNIS